MDDYGIPLILLGFVVALVAIGGIIAGFSNAQAEKDCSAIGGIIVNGQCVGWGK